jgi:uncharacterized protein (TIGR03066 family)
MRLFRSAFAPVLCLMLVAGAATRAADVDKAKLIGSWQMVLPEDAKIDLKVIITFANDGKAIMSFEGFGKKENKEGTWKLEGDKITVTPKDEKDKTETITVKSVSADKLILSDKSGKDMDFKKTTAPKPPAFEPETLAFARQAKEEPKSAEIDAKKLIGKWTVIGQKADVEFAKDGKLILMAEGIKIDGKYKLDKDKLTIVMDFGGKEQSEVMTIKSLSDTKMVTVDSKGKEEELTKAK